MPRPKAFRVKTTRHAALRWTERVEPIPLHMAFRALDHAVACGISVPRHVAEHFHPTLKLHALRKRNSYIATTRALLMIENNNIVTVLPFSFEAYISVAVWYMTEALPEEIPTWGRLPKNNTISGPDRSRTDNP